MSKRRHIFKLLTKMVLNFLNFSTLSQFFIVKLFNKSLVLIIIIEYNYYTFMPLIFPKKLSNHIAVLSSCIFSKAFHTSLCIDLGTSQSQFSFWLLLTHFFIV